MSKKDLIQIIDRLLNKINDINFIEHVYKLVYRFYTKNK